MKEDELNRTDGGLGNRTPDFLVHSTINCQLRRLFPETLHRTLVQLCRRLETEWAILIRFRGNLL